MKKFDPSFITDFKNYSKERTPDFNNILKVLNKEKPSRPTLYEMFMNTPLELFLSGVKSKSDNYIEYQKMRIDAFRAAGYDYCTIEGSLFDFPKAASNHGKSSMSVNSDVLIFDRESFNNYKWPDPEDFDNSDLDILGEYLPEGMKIISQAPCGVLENVTFLLGYEGICFMMMDDPELLQEVFDHVGSRLVKYYELAAKHSSVGALICNDDWGFATQTMLSADDMRKYVFPWHKKISDTIKAAGKPVILHSCGQLKEVYEDIINDLKFDGKHSYEDKIQPVEEAYEMLNPRIAVLGGIDLDYVCRSTPEEIYSRCCKMLERSADRGGYALGSGNSIPDYVPYDNYLAMICAVLVNS